MHTRSLKVITLFVICTNVSLSLAAAVPIGVVVSGGRFKLNSTETTGNVTVLDGSSIQTGRASTSVRLKNGARLTFAPDSRGSLSSDRLLLEQGSVRIAGYSVNANNLKIKVDHSSSATISIKGQVVTVTASDGNVHVFNAAGVNVANLSRGDTLDLHSQESRASQLSSMTGCVTKSGKSYLLTDVTSKVAVVLHGDNLTAGEAVQVSGRIIAEPNSSADAPKGLTVLTKEVLPGGCASLPLPSTSVAASAAAGAGAGAAGAGVAGGGAVAAGAAAGAAGGVVSGAVVAGVAVVAVAGTAVGLAVVSSNSSLSNGR
jgi:hypothetical protein